MTTFAPLGESLRSFSSNGELPLPFSEVRKGDAVAVHEEEAHGLAMKKARAALGPILPLLFRAAALVPEEEAATRPSSTREQRRAALFPPLSR